VPSLISIVITAFNEGAEVRRTIDSVRAATHRPYEIILVDDGSTDGSCNDLDASDLTIVRHVERQGVAPSRNAGCAVASGEVFAFLDAHQRLSEGCLNACAELAIQRNAIVWPDVRGLRDRGWTGHGATMGLCPKRGIFLPRWQTRTPRTKVSQITGLIAPGYVMPRGVYERVRWHDSLRGWGATEAAIWVKALCLDIEILHLCGPLARHLFHKTSHFDTPQEQIWCNHAIVARTCFDDAAWRDYWLPNVFAPLLSPATIAEVERCTPELPGGACHDRHLLLTERLAGLASRVLLT
jgi:glycosyltransferase involved in cell wall biosynthesis